MSRRKKTDIEYFNQKEQVIDGSEEVPEKTPVNVNGIDCTNWEIDWEKVDLINLPDKSLEKIDGVMKSTKEKIYRIAGIKK